MTRLEIVAVLRDHGFHNGRLIALSKSGYLKALPKHWVIFNSKLFIRRGLVLRSVDLDLTLDADKLTAAARAIGENLFVLCENDPSFFWQRCTMPISQVLKYAIWWTRIRPEDQDIFFAFDSADRRPRAKRVACKIGRWQGQSAYSVDCGTNPVGDGCNMSGAVVQLRGRPPKNLRIADRNEVFTAVVSASKGRPTRPSFYHRSGSLEYVWFTHGAALPAWLYDCCARQFASATFSVHRDNSAIHVHHGKEVIGLIWPCSIIAPEVVAKASQHLRSLSRNDSNQYHATG